MLEFNEYKRHGDASHAACVKGWTKDLSEDVIGKSSVIEILTHQKFGCVGVARDSVISKQISLVVMLLPQVLSIPSSLARLLDISTSETNQ